MESSPKDFRFQQEITTEKLPDIKAQIHGEVKLKGTSEQIIPYIQTVLTQAEKLGDLSSAVELSQIWYLSSQHMIMEEVSARFRANPIRIAKGFLNMQASLKEVERLSKNDGGRIAPLVKARIPRFFGRHADHMRQYSKSEELYIQCLDNLSQFTVEDGGFCRLELEGLLSYSQLKQGKKLEGLQRVKNVLSAFDHSPEGIWLKNHNYTDWAIWKSGIQIRTAEHFAKSKNLEDRELAFSLTRDAVDVLNNPKGNKNELQLRLGELRALQEKLGLS